jgi:DNA polymerase-3 subunit beta
MLNVQVGKAELSAALGKLLPFVERKTTIPILSNVLVSAEGNGTGTDITITATDLDKSLTVTVPDVKVKGKGRVTIPAHQLSKTLANVRTLEDPQVTITELENNWLQLGNGELRVKLPGMKAESFPVMPKLEKSRMTAYLGARMLRDMLARGLHCISEKESRYTFNGGLLEIDSDTVGFATTDGHRLARSWQNGQNNASGKIKTLVAHKALQQLYKLLDKRAGDVEFDVSDTTQFFKHDDWVMTSRTLTGQFPNYAAVIPKHESMRAWVTVPAQTLAQVVKRVGMYADERSGAMRFELQPGKGLMLRATCTESGEAQETLKCECESAGVAVKYVGLKRDYVLELLATYAKGELITFGVKDAESCVLVRREDSNAGLHSDYVLMPIRL